MAIQQASHQNEHGEGEEPHVPDERPSRDMKRLNEGHASDDDGDDEHGRSEEFTDGQRERVASQRGKGGEHIGRTVTESEKGDSGGGFAHPESVGDGGEVGAEKVGRRDADCCEEECGPYHETDKHERLGTLRCVLVYPHVLDAKQRL